MGSLLARAYKRILRGKLAQDSGEHWVTVNAGSKEGGEGGGSHVLLDGEGRVVAGMGGKFKGQNIDRIERKKFINQNAWNRQRKTLTEKAGDDTQLKRVVTAGMRSQAEKEADKSNDTWQKEGLYNALVRRTQRENKGMISVLHDHLDYKNAQPKAVNPIAEKIQKQSDGVKQIVTEAITKYNDLEAVNQLNSVPDGVNVVTEKGQFFKTGDLWSSPDGKKTLENGQMFRLLKRELKSQISNKDMDNLIGNELEKVQYKDVAEKVKDIDPNLAKEIENTENKYSKLKAENIAKAERSEHEKKRGGGHAISFEEQNTEKKLQELKAQAEAKITEGKQEAPKAEEQPSQAVAPKPEGEPRTMKNAFSDKYQKIDNSSLNEYQKVDNISNNKNTENGVTNMNTNQESQATAEAKSLEDQYRVDPFNLHALRGGSMHISPSAHKGEQSAVVKFYNKPEQSTIDMLKQNGFKWAQYKKSWVHNGEIGNKLHLDVLKALKGVAPAPQPSQATPTAQPTTSQATPTAQPTTSQATPTAQPTAYDVLNAKLPDAVSKADLDDAINTLKNDRYAVTEQNIKKALQWRKHSKLADDLIAQSPKSIKLSDLQTQAGLQSILPKDVNIKSNWTAYNYRTGYEPTTRHAGYESGNKKTKPYNDLVNHESNIVMFANKDGSPSGYGLVTKSSNNGIMQAHLITPETHASVTDHRIKQGDQSISGYIANEEAKEKASRETERQARIAKEGKSYNGTGIEHKNGRYEISFNSFPSFQLRYDMKENGFRWDPTAKVWHTTDREKLDQVLSKHFSERDAGESPTQA